MTLLSPRERAIAALEVIDRLSGIGHGGAELRHPTLDAAYRELGTAMNLEYGPLPDEQIAWHLTHGEDG